MLFHIISTDLSAKLCPNPYYPADIPQDNPAREQRVRAARRPEDRIQPQVLASDRQPVRSPDGALPGLPRALRAPHPDPAALLSRDRLQAEPALQVVVGRQQRHRRQPSLHRESGPEQPRQHLLHEQRAAGALHDQEVPQRRAVAPQGDHAAVLQDAGVVRPVAVLEEVLPVAERYFESVEAAGVLGGPPA